MVEGEFLEIGSVCNMRLVLPEDESSEVLAMFQSQNADSRYYLTKILKQKNNNLHCANDRTLIDEDQLIIDIHVQVDPSKVSHK
jgi:bifunctional N-acetylglucosamine-1-phosphate-uridyltransferase/glucosamine-1-phosphate-acetyltransferase GlmU-like protein